MAGRINIRIDQGAWFDKLFTWKAAGVGVNLTGYLASAKFFDDQGTEIAEVLSTNLPNNASGYITLDSSGNINVFINETKTATFSGWRSGFWRLDVTPPTGQTRRLLDGIVVLALASED